MYNIQQIEKKMKLIFKRMHTRILDSLSTGNLNNTYPFFFIPSELNQLVGIWTLTLKIYLFMIIDFKWNKENKPTQLDDVLKCI